MEKEVPFELDIAQGLRTVHGGFCCSRRDQTTALGVLLFCTSREYRPLSFEAPIFNVTFVLSLTHTVSALCTRAHFISLYVQHFFVMS